MDLVTQSKQKMESWHIGQTSEQRESGGRGPGHISTGVGDHGGISYGTYQYSTKTGGVARYLSVSPYGSQFEGLEPGTPAFSERWKEIAAADPIAFAKDQHDFAKILYYDVQMERLQKVGIDLSGRGPAVQDALWSTSVQYTGLTLQVFQKGLRNAYGDNYNLADLTDEQIVRAAQDYKIANVELNFENSPSRWPGILSRAIAEKDDLVGVARHHEVSQNPQAYEGKTYEQAFGEPEPKQSAGRGRANPMADGVLVRGERGDEIEALQNKLIQAGYTGKDGQPLKADKHYGENTEHAVREFQKATGLKEDGKAGGDTLTALDNVVREQGNAGQAVPVPPVAPVEPTVPSPAPAAPVAPVAPVTPVQEQAAPVRDLTAGERIKVVEPFGSADNERNRTIQHGISGEDAYRELQIHHPGRNSEAVRTGNARLADRVSEMVEGELETTRWDDDRNGIPLVHKDLILTDQSNRREVMIPNPVAGYVEIKENQWNSVRIYSHPAGHPDRELVGQVLHGERGSSPYKSGDYVEYGAPLIKQSDAGSPGAVHAHIELEPEQFRKYLGDMLNDRITLDKNAPVRDAMSDGVLTRTERGDDVQAMQEKLAALGYQGKDGKPLSTSGYFGDDTFAAVQKFQRDHGLKDDGKAGDKTLTALKDAVAEKAQAPKEPSMRDASHADNGRFNQAVDKLQGLEQQRAQGGLPPLYADKEQLDRVAGQLVASTKAAGLQQIDAVLARTDGTGVIAVQGTVGDAASRRVLVDHNHAATQSVEASTRQADAQGQSQQQEQNQSQQQEQNRARGM
ncbi:peptidoglycan-binding domain-containing protein [Stenotrophomonas sp. PS02289]|uniref:peptidoglycan-binding domain-containing protein n=1 Tax=Stenotrophomonas sp. PS02289 TaxID=2991422 RepID=UPI00249C6C1E|nr:peptidoglycan-binding domain-containing protein [Stenotrophomonas sp. PS02289]